MYSSRILKYKRFSEYDLLSRKSKVNVKEIQNMLTLFSENVTLSSRRAAVCKDAYLSKKMHIFLLVREKGLGLKNNSRRYIVKQLEVNKDCIFCIVSQALSLLNIIV